MDRKPADRLRGKAIMVVGSGTGIGAATVRRLCAEGARVCAADINLDAASALAGALAAQGHEAFAVPIDIADEQSVKAAFGTAVERLGRLDGAHINAADMRTIFADSDAVDVDLGVFDRTMSVNMRGHLLCARAAIPELERAGGGSLVFTSSEASMVGEPQRPSYAMAKSALNALVRHISSRWGKAGITANAVAPGFVMTPEMIAGGQVPEKWVELCLKQVNAPRLGEVDDIAAMVAHLLSADGRWINGQVFHVNGGSHYH